MTIDDIEFRGGSLRAKEMLMLLRWTEKTGTSDGWLALLELLASRSGTPLAWWMEQDLDDPALLRATTRMTEAFGDVDEEDDDDAKTFEQLNAEDTAEILRTVQQLFDGEVDK